MLKFSWRGLNPGEVEALEFKVRDAVGLRQGLSAENVAAPKTQLGDYLEKRLSVLEELMRRILERLEVNDPASAELTEGLCDLSGSGMVFPVDHGTTARVAFTAISPVDQVDRPLQLPRRALGAGRRLGGRVSTPSLAVRCRR